MSTLYDRALFDLGGPGWEPEAGHPAAMERLARPWNRRPLTAALDVQSIDLRLAEQIGPILGCLGFPVPKRWTIDKSSEVRKAARLAEVIAEDVAAALGKGWRRPPLHPMNLVPWFRTGEAEASVRIAVYERGRPCVAVVKWPSGTSRAPLKRRGFVEADGMLVRELAGTDVARVVKEVFPSFKRADMLPKDVILKMAGESPFPADAEDTDGVRPETDDGFGSFDEYEDDDILRLLGRARPAAMPAMSVETAAGLCRAAAILHAADARQPDVEFSAVRVYLEGIREIARAVADSIRAAGDVGLFAASEKQLREVLKLHTLHGNVVMAAGPAVRNLAVQWAAVAFHESLCRSCGVPPEAVEDLWSWNPFAEEPDLAAIARHEAARDCERRAARAATVLARAPSSLEACVEALGNPDAAAALAAALKAFPRGHDKATMAGADISRIRLSWDCLAIWSEARPMEKPTIGPGSPYSKLVSALYLVGTGEGVEEAPTARERMSSIFTRANNKAVLALCGQQEGVDGAPPVVVGWPVDAPDGRFLRYLFAGLTAAGPAAWREREKLSRSTKKLKKV